MPTHRRPRQARRVAELSLKAADAATAIGPIEHGCEIFGLSTGRYSLIDIIIHCLKATGPADVILSTWTAANADIGFAYRLLADGNIRSIRFIVDYSFPSRQPEYCAALAERFGPEAIRLTKNHAKFVTITNDAWALVIRTSMNLNENRRLESWELSDDRAMAEFLGQVVDVLFEAEDGQANAKRRPGEHLQQFADLFDAESLTANSTDKAKYFGDGPYSTDLRRSGTARLP